MTLELVQQYWALLAGSVIGLVVVLMLVHRAWQDSARGRLRVAVGELRQKRQDVAKQERVLRKAENSLAGLEARSDTVAPRRLELAREAVIDDKALLKILSDQVLVAQTKARTIIFEEFPPRRHDTLRQKYLEG